MRKKITGALWLLLTATACSRGESGGQGSAAQRARSVGSDQLPVVLFLGTSLTAGYGLEPDQAYPALVQRKIDSLGLRWRAVNAGLSGETSAGALRRLDWLLQGPIRIVVVETGANDGLRGLDLDSTRANLEAILAKVRGYDTTITIVLAGMEVPPNLGPRYAAQFRGLFRDLARRRALLLIPFLLQGVGGIDSLNQADGIHPTPRGQEIVADNVWRVVRPLVGGTGGPGDRGVGAAR
jgi:acyl-CoA thioesterase-1